MIPHDPPPSTSTHARLRCSVPCAQADKDAAEALAAGLMVAVEGGAATAGVAATPAPDAPAAGPPQPPPQPPVAPQPQHEGGFVAAVAAAAAAAVGAPAQAMPAYALPAQAPPPPPAYDPAA
jgi:hypothetical protein